MSTKISRQAYAEMFGPTVGDRLRLADTELFVEVEKDYTIYGEEVKFGGGKVIRDGMGQSQRMSKDTVDTVITNALIIDAVTGIIKAADADVPAEVERGILTRLEDARQAAALTALLEKYNAGEEVSITRTVIGLADSVPMSAEDMPEAEFTIDKMLDEEQNDWGFHWPLDALNQAMRPARPGDFGILAARVDQGKSSFIANVLSHFAPQVDKLFPGEDRSIIVLNNEGLGSRLNQRLTAF